MFLQVWRLAENRILMMVLLAARMLIFSSTDEIHWTIWRQDQILLRHKELIIFPIQSSIALSQESSLNNSLDSLLSLLEQVFVSFIILMSSLRTIWNFSRV